MNKGNYTVIRCFSGYESNDSIHLVYDLMNMITDMKYKLDTQSLSSNSVRWIMAQETFNWIISTCDGECGFYYQVEFSCTEPNKYSIMDIEVEFVDDYVFSKNNLVKLAYVEPVVVAWHHEDPWRVFNCDLSIPSKYLENAIAALKEEKLMKAFYVGCGKKVTIENVIFNNPATIVFWSDGTKTVVKKQKGDKKFDPEKGLAMAICKKIMGNKGNFNDIFKEWIEED